MSGLFDLTGRLAVVTGASRGIGKAMAVALAEAGADIIGVSTHLGSGRSGVGDEVQAAGRSFTGYSVDFADRAAVSGLGIELAERGVDILVNNAGAIERAPAVDHALELWDRVLAVDLSSQFVLTQAVARGMISRGHGKIIFTASLLSFQGGINVPGYAAAKHGIAGLTKALANEWTSNGISVNAIAPGYIATDNTQALQDDPKRSRAILERIPAGRWGQTSDLGGATVFLASAASDYVSGVILPVDGGVARTMTQEVFDQIGRLRIIPVVTIDDPGSVAGLADALTAGGLAAAEVTLRTPAGLAAIRELADRDGFLVGAGTVITRDDVDRSVDAGAAFIVSPGFDDTVVERAQQLGTTVIPGVATATELQRALRAGLQVVKLFPAESLGGPPFLRSLAAPFPGVRFFPSGGINPENVGNYLDLPEVLAVGASWMVPRGAVLARDGALIRGRAADARTLVSE